jgi:oligopeptide/dipeptide ABC transporter ATP-binding protein
MERGPTKIVFQDTRSAYTLGLLRSLPRLDGSNTRLVQIEGAPPDMRKPPIGDPFASRNQYATERCFVEMPPLQPVKGGDPEHLVAAWYDLREVLKQEMAGGGAGHPHARRGAEETA